MPDMDDVEVTRYDAFNERTGSMETAFLVRTRDGHLAIPLDRARLVARLLADAVADADAGRLPE